jgi:hypothetical protein
MGTTVAEHTTVIRNTIPTFHTVLLNIIFHSQKINLSFVNTVKLLAFYVNISQAR